MKKIILLLLCFVSFAAAGNNVFWLQIKASESRDSIEMAASDYDQLHIPYKVTTFDKGKTEFYRLRIGPFDDNTLSRQFADFMHIEDPWIVKETRKAESSIITSLIFDSIIVVNKEIFYYETDNCNAVIVYIKNYGIGATALPSDMHVYVHDRQKPLMIEGVTGFDDTDTSIVFGKAEKLFFNPDGLPDEKFVSAIETYADRNSIPTDTIMDNLIYFNDGQDAYFTQNEELLFNGKRMALAKHGFDYSRGGEKLSYSGMMGKKEMGNAAMQRLSKEEKIISKQCQKLTFLAKNHAGEYITTCILSKEN